MRLQPGDQFLLIGDSITDCGRSRRPAQWGAPQELGDGYVRLVHAALTAAYPDYGVQVLNMGVSGNTVRDLRARWQSDVLRLHPTWLSVMIGINDVWRHFDPVFEAGGLIDEAEFSRSLDEIVRQARPGLNGLALMTPYYVEQDRREPMRALMDRFGAIVREVAARHGAVLVDTQAAFDGVLASLRPGQLAADRVHVNPAGHMVLARALLNALEFDWQRAPGTLPPQ